MESMCTNLTVTKQVMRRAEKAAHSRKGLSQAAAVSQFAERTKAAAMICINCQIVKQLSCGRQTCLLEEC